MVQATSAAAWRSEQTFQPANDVQWDEPAPISSAVMALGRLVRARLREIVLAEADLHELEMLILLELDARGPLTRSELASLLHIDKAAAGRAVKSLQRLGLVDADVSRGPLSLSGEGTEVSGRLTRLLLRLERQALLGIGVTRVRRAQRALHAVHLAAIQSTDDWRTALAVRTTVPARRHGTDRYAPLVAELMLTARLISSIATQRISDSCLFSPFKARVLMQIAEMPASPRALTFELSCDKGQLSRMLGTLSLEGLVRMRTRRRNAPLLLTPAGRAAYGRIAAEMAAQDWNYHAVLDVKAPVVLTRVLGDIARNLDEGGLICGGASVTPICNVA